MAAQSFHVSGKCVSFFIVAIICLVFQCHADVHAVRDLNVSAASLLSDSEMLLPNSTSAQVRAHVHMASKRQTSSDWAFISQAWTYTVNKVSLINSGVFDWLSSRLHFKPLVIVAMMCFWVVAGACMLAAGFILVMAFVTFILPVLMISMATTGVLLCGPPRDTYSIGARHAKDAAGTDVTHEISKSLLHNGKEHHESDDDQKTILAVNSKKPWEVQLGTMSPRQMHGRQMHETIEELGQNV